jgi:hypothetical protein
LNFFYVVINQTIGAKDIAPALHKNFAVIINFLDWKASVDDELVLIEDMVLTVYAKRRVFSNNF